MNVSLHKPLLTAALVSALLSAPTNIYAEEPGQPEKRIEAENAPLANMPQESPQKAIDQSALQNALYDRPFVLSGQRASLGGYAEASVNFEGSEGITEGLQFNFQRFNLFVFAPIGQRIRFISELEFEEGAQEIVLETAQIDVEVVSEFIIRAGILLTPIGAFNQNHDSPNWNFVNRPLVSTELLGATFSEVGLGAHGTFLVGPLDLDYQIYATQGLNDGVVENDLGRISVAAGRSQESFIENNNGEPALTGRLAARYSDMLELGVSAWHGAYNTFVQDGEDVDERRTLTIGAVDMRVSLPWFELRGEVARVWVQVPESLETLFGTEQWGMHVDVVAPVWKFGLLGFDNSKLEAGLRFEHVDFHQGTLGKSGDSAGSEETAIVGALALRPGTETVFRLNYGLGWSKDLVGNESVVGAKIQLGFATYF